MPFAVAGFVSVHHNMFQQRGYSAISPGTDSVIEDNQISGMLLALSGGGGIHAGTATRVQIRRNDIRDVKPNTISSHGKFTIGHGVYGDDCSNGLTIEGNTLSEIRNGGGVFFHNSYNHRAIHNTFNG